MMDDDKYARIIKRHRPRGWRISYSGRRNKLVTDFYVGHKLKDGAQVTFADAVGEKRVFRLPYVICPITLHIALHEFGHVHLKHWTAGSSTRHREEFEAEHWAFNIMRIEGIAIPKSVRDGAREYVKDCIEFDLAAGIAIEPHIQRFADGNKKKA